MAHRRRRKGSEGFVCVDVMHIVNLSFIILAFSRRSDTREKAFIALQLVQTGCDISCIDILGILIRKVHE
jgi:hypothetical protein